jgi:hypothetical protein
VSFYGERKNIYETVKRRFYIMKLLAKSKQKYEDGRN